MSFRRSPSALSRSQQFVALTVALVLAIGIFGLLLTPLLNLPMGAQPRLRARAEAEAATIVAEVRATERAHAIEGTQTALEDQIRYYESSFINQVIVEVTERAVVAPSPEATTAETAAPGVLFADDFSSDTLDGWYVFAGRAYVEDGALRTTSDLLTLQLNLPAAENYDTHLSLSAVDTEDCAMGFNYIVDIDLLLQLLQPEDEIEAIWQFTGDEGWQDAARTTVVADDPCQWDLTIERRGLAFTAYLDGEAMGAYTHTTAIERNRLLFQFPNTLQMNAVEVVSVAQTESEANGTPTVVLSEKFDGPTLPQGIQRSSGQFEFKQGYLFTESHTKLKLQTEMPNEFVLQTVLLNVRERVPCDGTFQVFLNPDWRYQYRTGTNGIAESRVSYRQDNTFDAVDTAQFRLAQVDCPDVDFHFSTDKLQILLNDIPKHEIDLPPDTIIDGEVELQLLGNIAISHLTLLDGFVE